MKKLIIRVALITALAAANGLAGAGGAQTDFSGWWVLDLHKTHDVPGHLQSYQMEVTQTGKLITIQTRVEGDFRVDRRSQPAAGGGRNYPGGRQRGGGFPGGGGRMPGLPRGGGFPGGRSGYPGGSSGRGPAGPDTQVMKAMAFSTASRVATYNLDGTPSKVQVEKPIPGSTTLQATWQKEGKQLNLSIVENIRGNTKPLKVREKWKLSKDGQRLEVERSVHTPRGSAKIKMVFNKALLPGEKARQQSSGQTEP